MDTRFLLLEDGTLYTGTGFGAPSQMLGPELKGAELLFNTSMTGYQEILTDPSYQGQMVVMTYPHIGNYGCEPIFEEGLSSPSSISCTAFIIRSLYDGPLPRKRVSLDAYLASHNVSGISGIDTRSLTIHIRNKGAQNAALFSTGREQLTKSEYEYALSLVQKFPSLSDIDLIDTVATKSVINNPCIDQKSPDKPILRFAVVDFGIKRSIIKQLYQRGCAVTLFPFDVSAQTILSSGCDAMLLSNGPGDPERLRGAIAMTKEVMKTMPVFGICLGHQLITWALGGKTKKMKYGHHGGNHPVIDTQTKACFVTSQNHGYESDASSLPPEVAVWFRNANDQSVEGLTHTTKAICSVQFHPEASPGPHDASWIFDRFIEKAKEEI
ncbi:MAG: carbamoyl-phosphate synthase small subunit [Spirochaetia bacterium]|nr:carbamoyl-phosphate synthase small subunit [Spirochaetia bacterium]